ncbi:hypothetical protein PMY12_08635 [Clostridium tertium]|uniref:hypothetical protein n=2 Tax=Clostridium tertium TaxID=1559 RepID=UPI00232EDECE|nr:hypothetical protein [Clostridium tertium]MDB1934046.1 hypothetical protein [Clostridium tertium]MDB1937079.1 hypothetical protein [Clostridium tertium]
MNEFLQKSFLGYIEMYRVLTCILMLIIYGSYSYIKKNKPENLIYISNIILILSSIYIGINIILKQFYQDVYIFIMPFIVVAFILRNQAKHDKRGRRIYEIINIQKKWEKKDILFIPKEFDDKEIEVIFNILQEIFYEINRNVSSENIGGLFIKIRKKRKVKGINIINVLPNDKIGELRILKEVYEKIGKEKYGDLNIDEGKINRIELDIII